MFFVDFDILGAARTAVTVLVVDLDLFLFLTTSARQRGGEGSSASFVTFPSDALGVDLSFYSSTSSLVDDVAPVRRWEDAERDRDSGVKVQVDCGNGEGLVSWTTFEMLRQQFEGGQEQRLSGCVMRERRRSGSGETDVCGQALALV